MPFLKTPPSGNKLIRAILSSGHRNIMMLMALTIVMLYFGLRPFDYRIRNGVQWINNGPGIRLNGEGIIICDLQSSHLELCDTSESGFTLEIVLKPANFPDDRLPRILSFAGSDGKEIFFIGQWKDSMVLGLIDYGSLISKTRYFFDSSNVMDPDRVAVITLISTNYSTTIFLNGVKMKQTSDHRLVQMLDSSSISYLVLGNSPLGNDGWSGELLGLALFCHDLDQTQISNRSDSWMNGEWADLMTDQQLLLLLFKEGKEYKVRNQVTAGKWDFFIPLELTPLRREILSLPSMAAFKMSYFYIDAIINLVGFIPFGFILSQILSAFFKIKFKTLFFTVIIFSATLSLTIELNQIFLLSRDSSLTDLVLNTCGGMLGVFFYYSSSHQRHHLLSVFK